jgi:dienelactone hydrolase
LTQNATACSPGCGTVSAPSSASGTAITYTGPGSAPANTAVSLTATSITDTSKSASAAVMILIGSVKLVPASLNFGRIFVNASETLTTTLTNTGAAPLNITSTTTTGPYTLVSPSCGTSVSAGASCPMSVTFQPPSANSFGGSLTINDTSPGSPQQVALSGTGVKLKTSGSDKSSVRSAVGAFRMVSVPSVTGPNPVGTRTLQLVNTSQNDPFMDSARRELLVRFWYPMSPTQACRAAAYTSPHIWQYFSQLVGMPLPMVRTNSCSNGPLAEGTRPVVVFTPGYTGTFTDYTFLFEDLASRGYVVASIDHTYEATAVEFPDGRFATSVFGTHLAEGARMDDKSVVMAVSVRLNDLKFVLDELQRVNADTQSPFLGKLDLSSIALGGHSLGGLATTLGMAAEPRFRAAFVLDGVLPDRWASAIDRPVMVLSAGKQWGADEARFWDGLRGPRFAVRLRGSEHVTPSDMVWLAKGAIHTGTMDTERTVEAIRNYVAAFLESSLQGGRLDPLLSGPSAEYPDAEVTTQTRSLRRSAP